MAEELFLKLAGIAGESQDAKHKGEIDITGWSWGVAHPAPPPGGGGGAGRADFHALTVQKLADLASAPLLLALARGTRIATGTLTVRRAGAAPQEFLVVNLKDILVGSVTLAASEASNRPTEIVTLSFGQVDFEYTQFLASGAKGATKTFKWDIANNRPL
ncbi:MAG TPA: type VI secretion system tube protein Hcp [Stellaceae bacterium]|jgi:type VI secretion system secreted protein Hcp